MISQLDELYRRTGFTKESCFYASRRLNAHNTFSLSTLTFLTFSLIVVSLINQVYYDNEFVQGYSRFIDLMITSLSVLSVILSVLVHKSEFSLRSDRFQRQAMEINELRLSFRHFIKNKSTDLLHDEELRLLYERNSEEYSAILKRNLVHAQIDYLVSSTSGVENNYYLIRLFFTQYFGYFLINIVTLSLVIWIVHGTFQASL